MQFFVEVILPLSLAKTFTYSVSEAEFQALSIGTIAESVGCLTKSQELFEHDSD